MNPSEIARKRTLQQMMLVAKHENLMIMSPKDNPKIPYKMTEFDFRNTILDFPMTISPDDLAKIVEYYKEGRLINYGKFVDDLLSSAPTSTTTAENSNEQKHHINPKYIALAQFLHERNTDLLSLVSFMDRNSNGKITADNFSRCLTDFPLANDVAKISMDLKTREIDYIKLNNFLQTIDVKPANPESEPIDSNTLPKCFNEFVHLINERSIPIDEYFLREHRTKTGLIQKDKFFSFLYQLNLPMPRESIEKIAEFFADKDGNVDYKQFLASTDINKHETSAPPTHVVDNEANVQKIIKCFNNRNLNVWHVFSPHDKNETGKVSTTLFLKIVNQFNVDADPEDLRLAVEYLSDKETKTVDYLNFAQMVDKDKSVGYNDTIESALEKLRNFLIEKRISFQRALRSFDRDNSGFITTNQFQAALRKIDYNINDRDLKLILEKYEDKQNRNNVQWKNLCEDVDFTYGDNSHVLNQTSKGSLSFNSTDNFSGSLKDLFAVSPKRTTIYNISDKEQTVERETGPVPDSLIPLFGEIAECAMKFGLDIEGELISCDKLKNGFVSRTDFKQIIELLPMVISPNKLEELIQFYCKDTGKVYYTFFLQDLNEYSPHDEPEKEIVSPQKEPKFGSPTKSENIDHDKIYLTMSQRARQKTDTLSSIPSWAYDESLEKTKSMSETYQNRMQQPIDNLPDEVIPVLVKILNYTHDHSLSPSDIFKDFDKLHVGLIDALSIEAVLSSTGIYMSPKEITLLNETFRDKGKPDFINYLMICNAINNLSQGDTMVGTISLSQNDEDAAWRALNRVQTTLRNRRLSIRALFLNETRKTITSKELLHKLEDIGRVSMTSEERRLIIRKYHVNSKGDIDWRKLCDDSEKTIRIV